MGYNLKCPNCQETFYICKSCFRGEKFCSSGCKAKARKKSIRLAGSTYQSSPIGRKHHCLRQKRYRKNQRLKKNVTHHSSDFKKAKLNPQSGRRRPRFSQIATSIRKKGSCIVCRRPVDWFFNLF